MAGTIPQVQPNAEDVLRKELNSEKPSIVHALENNLSRFLDPIRSEAVLIRRDSPTPLGDTFKVNSEGKPKVA